MERLRKMTDSLERTRMLYGEIFTDEAGRIEGEGYKLEALTTLHILGQEIAPASRVLDLGCGAGVYALPLAEKGHTVMAVDLMPSHIEQLKAKTAPGLALEALCMDAQAALDGLPEASFEAVLCLGPMYHLRTESQRVKLLAGCRRVTRPGGRIFIAFINNDWVIATQALRYDGGRYMTEGDYHQDTFRVEDFPFVFHTLAQANEEAEKAGLKVFRRVNTDGLSEMFEDKFAAFTPDEYARWFRYHLYLSEKQEHLGACNHWLFVCGRGPG
ncbi:MAG: class I SAM-dependent methyltransferase [Eubacteriales bacterium]|jgi:2-polyprenyl-3-methyl-5-hydroxy-6-metoxy-1,4-benzoquinol methylase|nr:class I SAM-dependent methyltransferase [Eubacteriales bacterium]